VVDEQLNPGGKRPGHVRSKDGSRTRQSPNPGKAKTKTIPKGRIRQGRSRT